MLQRSSNNAEVHDEDLKIIRRIITGKKHDFELLIRKFNQQLFRIGMAYLKNETDTEDAMQSAYLKAFEHLSSFRAEASFSTWLIRIMMNECLLLIRAKEKSKQESASRDVEDYQPDGMQILINTEMKELLERSILKLPQKYRLVYIFRSINEFSTLKTAELLSLTPENVKVRLHRAKQLLKDAILKEAGEKEAFSFRGDQCDTLTSRTMRLILMRF